MIPETGKYWAFRKPKSTRRSSDNDKTVSVINTDSVDRHGTIIEPSGADISNYQENNVFLINHDERMLAGTSTVKLEKNQWISEVRDQDWDDSDPEIMKWKNKVVKQIMRMTSVGIIPIEIEEKEVKRDKDSDESYKVPVIKTWELLEWSFVTVGSNPDALIQNRRASGNDMIQFFEELNRKLDQVLNMEFKLPDSQFDSLVESLAVDRYQPPKETPTPKRYMGAGDHIRDRWSDEKIMKLANQIADQKLGKR